MFRKTVADWRRQLAPVNTTRPDPPGTPFELSGYSIVYFGNDWVTENRTSSHHIARLLGKHHHLLYVETPGQRAPSATARDFRKLWEKLRRAFKPAEPIGEHMWLLTAPQIPFRRLPLIRRLNQLYGRYVVRRAVRKLGFQRVLLWFAVPHPAPLVGQLREQFVVYYCTDDYSCLPGVDRAQIAHDDEQLTRAADQVFVTAMSLLERKQQLNSNCFYSPHGVDFSHFNTAADRTAPVPKPVRHLRPPVIGFFGSIAAWVDIELLMFVAGSKPEWTLLLVGLPSVDVSELRKCPNVILAGPQPYENVPDWARAFDVAILPFRSLDEVAIHANPLKLREYLATGKPIVAVSIPEIERFAHCVAIARDHREFLEKIDEVLTRDTEVNQRLRVQEVMGCTWEARVEEVLKVVQARLPQRFRSPASGASPKNDSNQN